MSKEAQQWSVSLTPTSINRGYQNTFLYSLSFKKFHQIVMRPCQNFLGDSFGFHNSFQYWSQMTIATFCTLLKSTNTLAHKQLATYVINSIAETGTFNLQVVRRPAELLASQGCASTISRQALSNIILLTHNFSVWACISITAKLHFHQTTPFKKCYQIYHHIYGVEYLHG